jgi:hypothetical protein
MAKRAIPKTGAQVTAQDVARTLGVSQSTISRAFSMTASISEEMKLRVIKAANKLGYRPNVIARSLITRQTNMVAIVMANLVDPFYPVVLDELVQQVQAGGLHTSGEFDAVIDFDAVTRDPPTHNSSLPPPIAAIICIPTTPETKRWRTRSTCGYST